MCNKRNEATSVHTITDNPSLTLCVEDASLQHFSEETFYSYTSYIDT
jgi:hypothetical protein